MFGCHSTGQARLYRNKHGRNEFPLVVYIPLLAKELKAAWAFISHEARRVEHARRVSFLAMPTGAGSLMGLLNQRAVVSASNRVACGGAPRCGQRSIVDGHDACVGGGNASPEHASCRASTLAGTMASAHVAAAPAPVAGMSVLWRAACARNIYGIVPCPNNLPA